VWSSVAHWKKKKLIPLSLSAVDRTCQLLKLHFGNGQLVMSTWLIIHNVSDKTMCKFAGSTQAKVSPYLCPLDERESSHGRGSGSTRLERSERSERSQRDGWSDRISRGSKRDEPATPKQHPRG